MMGHYTNNRQRVVAAIKLSQEMLANLFEEMMGDTHGTLTQMMRAMDSKGGSASGNSIKHQTLSLVEDHRLACSIAEEAKTILFPSEQATVFTKISKEYTDSLEYMLPFSELYIQFSAPVPISRAVGGSKYMLGLLLNQIVVSPERRAKANDVIRKQRSMLGLDLQYLKPHDLGSEAIKNFCYVVLDNGFVFPAEWECVDGSIDYFSDDEEMHDEVTYYRNLAIACIGYINCENIYLHQEEVPYKINHKRERQGKKILEPYYVCRIKGVQYDSNGNALGEGTHHGFRYDVRGHFRKMATGKTTWVRPHQRGIQNELYVPKTYVVAKQSASTGA